MQINSLIDEIHEMNLAYLLLAQRLINEDRVTAKFRLKIDDEMADLLQELNARQLTRLSRVNQLLCHFGHDSAEQLRQLTHNPREQGLTQFHASLLMASRSAASTATEQ
ncbi:flagellar transcriptional regulator FlhD [Halomonas saccharevitans]|jgi:flagellar transcriptional activator FlhD|uniref:Flagellar transcriptional regulator FlhD n=1 Tax=Halomonas saccharevitans TaxID=416872 RepID=A0ABU3NF78_9GAMM|nr:flagellar transcriptional regulator FlhD [Halomonas saccharevitans]MDT8879173.1 flagellar transcriptional regulator FlhD [Halomonas saccharevitans]